MADYKAAPRITRIFYLKAVLVSYNIICFILTFGWAPKIEEWLKVLRKKNTYVLIATQEIADIVKAQDLIDINIFI